MGPSHKADASLRLHAPSLSLVPQRKRGRKKGKTKCPINSITLVGFVGSDPEQRQAKGNGSKFTVLSVATQRSWKNADDEWNSKTDWHRVVVFLPLLAERVATTIKKGSHLWRAPHKLACSLKARSSVQPTNSPTAKAKNRKPRRLRRGRFTLMSCASSIATSWSHRRLLQRLLEHSPESLEGGTF